MRLGWEWLCAAIFATAAARAQGQVVGSAICAACHADVWQSYRATGMARSFFRPAAGNTIEDYGNSTYYHPASDTYFETIPRGGSYFQRQYQMADGKRINVTESAIDYVMGSGNHARTYLTRTGANELIELPLGWYAERGGYWAMNPGYDRPDHAGLSRAIPYGCMFCHNGYPEIPGGKGPRADPVFLSLPEGIDCQRCHGDGREHMRLAHVGGRAEEIRGAIVNPARLPANRQLEACLQCHLDPNGASVSNVIPRFDREPFSYKPGEPLADFRLYFDQSGDRDRFEIVGAASYRLMQSHCFRQSKSTMTCITCHDPHRKLAGQEAARRYADACRKCHGAKLETLARAGGHPALGDCVSCHMPKRRTADAVHVVMTDHLIQRKRPERDLLAPLRETIPADRGGAITPFYPAVLTRAEDQIYLGIAQTMETSNRSQGIARLAESITKVKPDSAEYYLNLGDALRASRRYEESIAPYQEAVRREPGSGAAHERLGLGLARLRQFAKADTEFGEALRLAPANTAMRTEIGLMYLDQGRWKEAAATFEASLAIDPNQAAACNGLGGARIKSGDLQGGEAAFRQALLLRPHYVEAHHNLAFLLSFEERYEEAQYH
jgi:Flp pilus assembly protein TadD